MKTAIFALTTLAMAGSSLQTATAGNREWATAGKVLTGVVAAEVVTRACEPAPVYSYQTTAYYPSPAIVVPQPVYVQPAPVIVYAQPVCVQPVPVYVRPAPVVAFRFGFGDRHHRHFQVCR